MAKLRLLVCWLLLGIMASLVIAVISPLRSILRIPGDISNYVGYLAVLGVLLVISTILTKMSRVLKVLMITAGVSAAGWIIGVGLHSLLFRFFPTEPVTYVLVFYVLPVTFLIGILGSIVIGIKQLVTR